MIERWFEPFTLLESATLPDGLGGECTGTAEALTFRGVLSLTAGETIALADQPALLETPVLLHEFDITLAPGDQVRRERDGALYRVRGRSDGLRAPAFSGLRFAQVPVERMVCPC